MDEQRTFEQRAAQCRRLANSVNDRQAAERLLELAEEYDAKAAKSAQRDRLQS
jgi:hypothetical protein